MVDGRALHGDRETEGAGQVRTRRAPEKRVGSGRSRSIERTSASPPWSTQGKATSRRLKLRKGVAMFGLGQIRNVAVDRTHVSLTPESRRIRTFVGKRRSPEIAV
jgi:hypothetical protein